MPKVSIVIPIYNTGKYIEVAVRSCLNQTFDDYEIIVVNDGSTDNTAHILDVFGNRVKVINLDTNMGRSHACNIGIRSCESPFIVRVDSDDYINENLLKVEYLFLVMNKEMDAVACDYLLVDESENVISRQNCDAKPIGCGVMFRKDRLVEIGLYDESFELAEDDDLRIRYLSKYNIHRIPLPLYRYRRHSANSTNDAVSVEAGRQKLREKHGSHHC